MCPYLSDSDKTLHSWSLFRVRHTSSIAAILRKAVRVGPCQNGSGSESLSLIVANGNAVLVLRTPLTMIKHKRRYRNVVTGNRSESHAVKQHGMEKQRLAVCARHTKNGRTKWRAKSSTRNHKCVAGPLHLTIWWWATSVLRFGWPVQGFCQKPEH